MEIDISFQKALKMNIKKSKSEEPFKPDNINTDTLITSLQRAKLIEADERISDCATLLGVIPMSYRIVDQVHEYISVLFGLSNDTKRYRDSSWCIITTFYNELSIFIQYLQRLDGMLMEFIDNCKFESLETYELIYISKDFDTSRLEILKTPLLTKEKLVSWGYWDRAKLEKQLEVAKKRMNKAERNKYKSVENFMKVGIKFIKHKEKFEDIQTRLDFLMKVESKLMDDEQDALFKSRIFSLYEDTAKVMELCSYSLNEVFDRAKSKKPKLIERSKAEQRAARKSNNNEVRIDLIVLLDSICELCTKVHWHVKESREIVIHFKMVDNANLQLIADAISQETSRIYKKWRAKKINEFLSRNKFTVGEQKKRPNEPITMEMLDLENIPYQDKMALKKEIHEFTVSKVISRIGKPRGYRDVSMARVNGEHDSDDDSSDDSSQDKSVVNTSYRSNDNSI
jgi:hypothetical protein